MSFFAHTMGSPHMKYTLAKKSGALDSLLGSLSTLFYILLQSHLSCGLVSISAISVHQFIDIHDQKTSDLEIRY